MSHRTGVPIVASFVLALACTSPVAAITIIPPDFVVENVAPGANFDTPVGIAFLPGGRMLVAEKRGVLWAVKNGVKHPTPMWSRENEVLNVNDRGFLGLAVDPNYVNNRYIYLLYSVDPDSNGVDTNDDAFGRLTRYEVSLSDSNIVDPASRTILFGRIWPEGPLHDFPSHSIGCLRFGTDGSLLVSIGDGASYENLDPGGLDGSPFTAGRTDPYEDIGAFRSQYLGSLCGKILRINPLTGRGYASNPFVDGNLASVRSRVWAYGLRQPYRFNMRPGTGSTDTSAANPGTLYINEVGWTLWEETNVCAGPGRNFGWPCYEGIGAHSGYQNADPAHHGCGTMGTPENPSNHTPPLMAWHHSNANLSVPSGFIGNAATGAVFYAGDRYPSQFRNQYFFSDYGQNWIKVAVVNANNQLQQVLPFATSANGPVDLVSEPGSGDLIYVSLATDEVRRIRYVGQSANTPPVANASAAPSAGPAPLVVDFSSAGSTDLDQDPLTFSWLFGDGQGSSNPNPQHTYVDVGSYQVILTVDDGHGGISRDTLVVIATAPGGFPSTPVLDNFNRPNGPVGAPWVDAVTGFTINTNMATQTCCYITTVWNGASFGPDQEAYFTFDAVTATAPEQDLMLKVQGTTGNAGHIEVRYDARFPRVGVNTYHPGAGWAGHGTHIAVGFAAGDQLGARAYSNGTVEVYKNGAIVGTRSVASWAFYAQGGRLGMTIDGALSSRFENFGGGTYTISSNTPPEVTINAPADSSFFVEGESVGLSGTATDAQQSSGSLGYEWRAHLHHNTHVHPSVFIANGQNASFVPGNHEDGTGTWYELQLVATDSGSLGDTARVLIYPEVDLAPSPVTTIPSTPGTTAPAEYRFKLHNTGRMPARISRWRLVANNTLLAEGDTLVAEQDSVQISRTLPPVLSAGTYTLRVKVDTLAVVHELNEANNSRTRQMTVVNGPGPDEVAPILTLGPLWSATNTQATVRWHTNEPAAGVVRYGTTTGLGDSALASTAQDTILTALINGILPATEYYFRVTASDPFGNTRVSALDSLIAGSGTVDVPASPLRLALSNAYPNPTRGAVGLWLDLPHSARVEFSVIDVQGREVWSTSARTFEAGHWPLGWSGKTWAGTWAAAGLYLARVRVDGMTMIRRVALIR